MENQKKKKTREVTICGFQDKCKYKEERKYPHCTNLAVEYIDSYDSISVHVVFYIN